MTRSADASPERRKLTPRRLLGLGLVVLIPIVGVMVLMWALQRSLIYFPDTTEVPPAEEALTGGEDLTITTADGLDLGAWFAPAAPEADDREMAVLMAPGNGGNRALRAELAGHLQDAGFAVLVMDYRGYSTNPGSPSEEGLLYDAQAALGALESRGYRQERIIYFGESLGGAVIAALMREHPPAATVLRSPFTELAEVGAHHYPWLPVRTLLREEYPVAAHVAETDVPVSVIWAEQDSVVPPPLSAEVAAAASQLVEQRVFEGADHNDPVMVGEGVAAVVGRIADSVES